MNLNGFNVYKPLFHGINDIHHEGNISKMPDFDVFPLSDIKET